MTFLSPLLFVGIAAFVAYLSTMKSDIKKIAVHDEQGIFVQEFENTEEYQFDNLSAMPIDLLKDSLIAKNYHGVIFIPKVEHNADLQKAVQYISDESPSMTFLIKIEKSIAKVITASNYELSGMDAQAIEDAQADVSLQINKISGEESVKGLNEIKVIIGGSFGYLIMMFIIIYGNLVMRSVIEEKTNRIIEIIISSVKPFQLMMGKIIGTSFAGILQFLIWAILGAVLFVIASFVFGVNLYESSPAASEMLNNTQEVPQLSSMQLYLKEFLDLPLFTLFITFLFYFVGGYFLYSSFYAAIGAAVDNETDSQQFLLPIIMPLILGVYIGFFTVINDPHGMVATVFSMIPLTSPIVMLMRIPFGVPLWQIIVSLVILFATFVFVVWFASKIYRVGILMYGKKPTWKELIKWLKY
jgi:ABC-2 type transport system permease protein